MVRGIKLVKNITSDANGLIQFEDIQADEVHRLTEVAAPNGFMLPDGHWYIVLDENGEICDDHGIKTNGTWVLAFRSEEINGENQWFIGNMREITLPDSGGIGTRGLIVIGALSLILAALLCTTKNRRISRRKN